MFVKDIFYDDCPGEDDYDPDGDEDNEFDPEEEELDYPFERRTPDEREC